MKILYVFGGIPPYANSLLNRLTDKGLHITAVIPPQKSSMIGKGVKIVGEDAGKYKVVMSREKKSILGKPYFIELPDIIDSEKPDILVAGWPFFLAYFHQPSLRKSLRRNNTKFVIREIPFQVAPYGKLKSFYRENPVYDEDMKLKSAGLGFYFRQWMIAQIRKYCYSRADGALAYSSLGQEIMPTYGIQKEKVFVTYNANDSEALLAMKRKLTDKPFILFPNNHRLIHVGRLVKWKRVDLLMDAFAKILPAFPDAELIIVGNGPEMENLKNQALDLKIDNKVLFTNEIYDNQLMGEYLSASSVYVLAGMGGLSINDAMTFDLPVICSVCDSTERDLITDGVNGLFFKENDAGDLAEKIAALFSDNALRMKMGRESLRVIEEKINIDTVSQRYIEAYAQIAGL